jgi:hypothetical protein
VDKYCGLTGLGRVCLSEAMLRKVVAWLTLVTLQAAIVPGELASWRASACSCCDRRGQCAMSSRRSNMAVHCHDAGAATQDRSMDCTCKISQGGASMIPPPLFHFIVPLPLGRGLTLPGLEILTLQAVASNPLAGFSSPRHHPPK